MDTRPDESQPSPLEPERRHDGSPVTVKTNPKQTVQPECLPDARAEKSKLADLRNRRRNLTAYNQSFSSKLLACTTYIFIDSCKLEDATTQPSGREETVGDSDSCNLSEAMNRRSKEIGKTPRERDGEIEV
ncbi:hypothetical protein F2Q68_00016732 [Brassica cretica]|uniref:Uncharacterized protein n=1 Tax=Brassica cretica TaxID=69181 RepID=A0A8S9HB52_BRACR|nr:hypothetical protein F2Q68_00016732 [Brassica cretica]